MRVSPGLRNLRPVSRCAWLRSLLLGLVAAAGSALAAPPPGAVIGPGVFEAIARDGETRVLIAVRVKPPGKKPEIRDVVDAILAEARGAGLHVERRFGTVPAFAATLDRRALEKIARHPHTLRIDLDAPGRGMMTESRPLAEMDSLFASDFTGSGAVIAILDSGVHLSHPDLGGSVVDEACFCSGGTNGCCAGGGYSDAFGPGSAQDDHGHGSNVAGIVVSQGFVSPRGGAPGAALVAVKVLDAGATFCCSSDVIAGLDWLIVNHADVDVVNLSLGTTDLFSGACDAATSYTLSYASAIASLRALGAITVASSGNNGSGTQLAAPACIAGAIAVAAAWDASVGAQFGLGCADLSTHADQVTCFSNTNAGLDLVASGNPMTSAGYLSDTSTFVGTSNASPLVTACAGILRGLLPGLPASSLETALRTSPVQVVDTTNGLSFPRLDCAAALDAVGFEIPALPAPAAALLGLLLASVGGLHVARRRGLRRARRRTEETQSTTKARG